MHHDQPSGAKCALLAGALLLSFLVSASLDARTLTPREAESVARRAAGPQWRAALEIMDIESDFRTHARNPKTGCFGPFQIHPVKTWPRLARRGMRKGRLSDQIAVIRAYVRTHPIYKGSWVRALAAAKGGSF